MSEKTTAEPKVDSRAGPVSLMELPEELREFYDVEPMTEDETRELGEAIREAMALPTVICS